ncbi:MAG: sigma 54-interacting transcriptional regulator [Syntrophomonadaceae bacterium]|nr:sigma 54-interacting transcriptional regulator [Syntrophomonadaceae bacterium]
MKVKDIMTPDPYLLRETDTLEDAARLFIEKRIDGAPVVDDKQELTGLITKSHILRTILNNGSLNTPIKNVMETEVITTNTEVSISALNNLGAERLPVIENGKVKGIVTSSDLVKAYFKSARDLGQELNTVIDSAYNAIITVDVEGYIRIFNKSAEKLLDYPWEQAIGKLITDIMPDSSLLEIVRSGKTEPSIKIYHKEKTLVSNRTPIILDGKIVGAVAIVQDVSELENILKELYYAKELNNELDAIIESSFDGIFVTDAEGKAIRINEAYSRITGIKQEEVLGKTMHELVQEGVYDQSATILVMERGEPVTISQEVRTGKTVLVTGNPVFDENGKLIRVVTNVRDITELNNLRQELEQAYELSQHYQEQLSKYKVHDKYIMQSPKSRELIDLVLRLGKVDSTVLIQGESGVGKEVIAEILHSNSLRKDKPLVKINCGAIPETLLESELFGYEAGAFTGAKKEGKMGLFEIANGGTLMLDEIGELPLTLQVKLLRVIQEREITRVGGTKAIPIDVRIIAATNRDLREMVERNEFRKDLFYRLNVVPVVVPPLRERKDEIPALVAHFIHRFNKKYGLNKRLDEGVLQRFLEYDWPGNVRELENVIERAVVISPSDIILEESCFPKNSKYDDDIDYGEIGDLKTALEKLEKKLIADALEKYGSTRKAAKVLGISQPSVVRKAAKYGIKYE